MRGADARELTRSELASMIQFTNVRPYAPRDDIIAHVEFCAEQKFDGAMVANCWVPEAREVLHGTGVKVATCIGLGFGQESLHGKVALVRECVALGADEIDYEPNMALFLSGMHDAFRAEAAVPWIKNSSGWGEGGIPANEADIGLLAEVCAGTASQVKASGQVNSYEKAVTLINAGAGMIGTSSGNLIMDGYPE